MGQWDGIDGDPITHGMSIIGNYQLGLEDALWPDLNARQILESEFNGISYGLHLDTRMRPYRVVFTYCAMGRAPLAR